LTDLRFQKINEITEKKFFEINDFGDVEEKLKGYKLEDRFKWGLFTRKTIDWKLACRGIMFDDFVS
jgi:hypothetical protein